MKKILSLLMAGMVAAGSLFGQSYSKELEKKANGGDTEAMIELGDAYYKGNGIKQDAKKAEKWYKKAIKKDNIKGYTRMAELYSSWDGLEKNPEKQEEWQLMAARAGDPDWANFYGNKYFDEKRYAEAQSFFEKAIKGGVTDSYGKLAYCQVIGQRLLDAIITAENIGDNINEKGSSDYYGVQARKRAYAQLGHHYLARPTQDDLLETVIYCTGLEFSTIKKNVKNPEVKMLELLKSVEFCGKTPEFTYLKGIGTLLSGRTDMAIEFFEKAFEQGVENAGIALYGMTNGSQNFHGKFKPFVADDPLLNILSPYILHRYNGWPIRDALETSNTTNQNFLANKPTFHVSNDERYVAMNRIRKDWARNGNMAALKYWAKERNMDYYELAKELNCYEALAQRGDLPSILHMYDTHRKSNSDKAAYWDKCVRIAIPVGNPAACTYLYHKLYKNYGDNGTIEFIDYVMQENPDYLIQWLSYDKILGKNEKVSILRMAASDTSKDTQKKIEKVLKDDYGTIL